MHFSVSKTNRTFASLVIFTLIYVLVWLIYQGNNVIAGLLFMIYGMFAYVVIVRKSHSLVDLRAIFLLTWSVTLGAGMLRLLRYQIAYTDRYFVVIYLGMATMIFFLGIGNSLISSKPDLDSQEHQDTKYDVAAYRAVLIISALAIGLYILSTARTGIIALFSTSTTAYLNISTKYMSILVGLAPISALAYYCATRTRLRSTQRILMYFCVILNLFIFPVLNVSRGNLINNVVTFLPVFYYCSKNKGRDMFLMFLAIIVGYMYLSRQRNYSDIYLIQIFEPINVDILGNNIKLSPYVSYLYSYLTASHDTSNLNINFLTNLSNGARLFQPFNEILNIQKFSDIIANTPAIQIKKELNTLDMFGYIYSDLGTAGVIVETAFLALFWGACESFYRRNKTPISYMVLGITTYCVALSFFTPKLSFVTLMWYGISFLCYVFIYKMRTSGHVTKNDSCSVL